MWTDDNVKVGRLSSSGVLYGKTTSVPLDGSDYSTKDVKDAVPDLDSNMKIR